MTLCRMRTAKDIESHPKEGCSERDIADGGHGQRPSAQVKRSKGDHRYHLVGSKPEHLPHCEGIRRIKSLAGSEPASVDSLAAKKHMDCMYRCDNSSRCVSRGSRIWLERKPFSIFRTVRFCRKVQAVSRCNLSA